MDVLTELEELVAPLELPETDYSGSLDFIDSLSTRPPLLTVSKRDVLSARDAFVISNDFDDDSLPQSLPHDNRRFNLTTDFDPGELTKGASRLTHEIPPDTWERIHKRLKPRPLWWTKSYHERPLSRQSRLSSRVHFSDPDKLEICIKRRMRREVLGSLGMLGVPWPRRRYSPFSLVRC